MSKESNEDYCNFKNDTGLDYDEYVKYKLIKKYKNRNEEKIKKELCEKIMNGEIKLEYDFYDTDIKEFDNKYDKTKLYEI